MRAWTQPSSTHVDACDDALPMTKPTTIDAYLAMQPEETQAVLRKVRATLQKAMPKAEECISYAIPAFKLHGSAILFFAGWKKHFSLYPTTAPLLEAFGDELAGYEISKGTIRFPLEEAPPLKLIARIAKFRVKEADAKAAAKKEPAKNRTRA